LIRLLLRHIVVCRLDVEAEAVIGSQRGRRHRLAARLQSSARRAASRSPSRPSRRQVSCSAAALRPTGRHGSHRLAAQLAGPRRAHLVGKCLARRRRFGPQDGTAVIGSPRGGSHRLAARRQSSARRAAGSLRGGSHRLAARLQSSARRAAAGLRLQGSWPGFGFCGTTVMVVPGRPGRGVALTRTELTRSAEL
jgi:hypothetical protein